RDHRGLQQSFHVMDFAFVRGGDQDSQRCPLAIHEDHGRGAFAFVANSHKIPPFFARQKVPSAIRWFQSMSPSSSERSISRAQTSISSPSCVHVFNRRRQVDSDGAQSGKSCQRPPFRSNHNKASSTTRG